MEVFEILPGQLYQSGAPEEGSDWEPIHARRIDVVVDLYVLTDAAVRLIGQGHRVLAHCHMGKSRSGLFNAIVVMKMQGVDGRTAVDIMRRGRPGALGNQTFVSYLEGLPAPKRPAPA